ncbi:hypothetical protein ACWCXK_22110 [Streptomyces sp. NPDC001739]
MMSDAVVTAVRQLQVQALHTRDSYGQERIERALDELLRRPHEDGPVPHLKRSALGHAYQTIERRRAIAPQGELTVEGQEPGYAEASYHEVEMEAWVRRQPIKETDRSLLLLLARGSDAVSLAAEAGVPVSRMRERISRCRRRARHLWATLETAA